MKKKIAIIKSAGSSQEVMDQAIKSLNAIADQFDHQFDLAELDSSVEGFTETMQTTCKSCDAILITGTEEMAAATEAFSIFATVHLITFRSALQHLSPIKTKNSEGTNFLIYQEVATPDAENHAQQRDRICQSAFKQALSRHKKITFVPGQQDQESWWQSLQTQQQKYDRVQVSNSSLSSTLSSIIAQPRQFDLIIADQSAGNLLLNQCAIISGTPYMIPAIAAGQNTTFFSPAYPLTASDPSKNVANPIGAILSIALMLDYFGMGEESNLVRGAVNWTLLHGFVTRDIDPVNNYSTSTLGDLIGDFIRGSIPGFARGENIELHKSTII